MKRFLLNTIFFGNYRQIEHLTPRARILSMNLRIFLAVTVTCLFAKWVTGSFSGNGIFWTCLLVSFSQWPSPGDKRLHSSGDIIASKSATPLILEYPR